MILGRVQVTGRSLFIQICLAWACSYVLATAGAAPTAGPAAASRDGLWRATEQLSAGQAHGEPWIQPRRYRAFSLDRSSLGNALGRVRKEFSPEAKAHPVIIDLPMPDGTYSRFEIVESPVMGPALAAKFPQIKTYTGWGKDDPQATVRVDRTPAGFHAQILSPKGAVYIDPYFKGNVDLYTSYYKRDYRLEANDFVCLVNEPEAPPPALLSRAVSRKFNVRFVAGNCSPIDRVLSSRSDNLGKVLVESAVG